MKKVVLGLMFISGIAFGAGKVIETNDANFKKDVTEYVECGHTVVVEVYADWCGYCKQMEPMLEVVAKRNPNIRIVKLDADKNKSIEVRALPTLAIYKGGKVYRVEGAAPSPEAIEQLLKKLP